MSPAKRLSVQETVELKLVASGERERLKKLAKERLEESGWTDEVRQLCREYVHSAGAGAVRQEEIVAEVRPAARAKVPDGLKAELLTRIRAALEA